MNAELMPFVILESFACGKPVVASDVGGVKYIVDDKVDGLLIKPKDKQDLIDKISYLLENEDVRKKMGKNAIKKAKGLSWNKSAKEIIKIYGNA